MFLNEIVFQNIHMASMVSLPVSIDILMSIEQEIYSCLEIIRYYNKSHIEEDCDWVRDSMLEYNYIHLANLLEKQRKYIRTGMCITES